MQSFEHGQAATELPDPSRVRYESTGEMSDFEALRQITQLADYIVPICIRTVSDLGVADVLADGPMSIADLASKTGTHERSLQRVMRALACRGIFSEVEPGHFALTKLADLLRSDHPLSVRDGYPLLPADIRAYARFDHAVKTGEPSFDLVHDGKNYWEYHAENPVESERFDRTQAAGTKLEAMAALRAYDWTGLDTVCDVGGGNGMFLASLLSRRRKMKGILVDQAHVVAHSAGVFQRAGVADRCQVVGRSLFETPPSGADAYLVKRILWGWADEDVLKILRNIRSAMGEGSRLLAIEPVARPGDDWDIGKIWDLHMLALDYGWSRSREEHEAIFAEAGLRLTRIVETPFYPVIEALPV